MPDPTVLVLDVAETSLDSGHLAPLFLRQFSADAVRRFKRAPERVSRRHRRAGAARQRPLQGAAHA